jgi:hypothetical protein
MPHYVKVQHLGEGRGSLTYRYKGRPITLEREGDQGEMLEELYNQHKDKLILVSDLEFLKISPDYKGTPEPFKQPRPLNPLAQRAMDIVEKNQVEKDDGLEALKVKLKELEDQWVGRSDPETYVERYGKDNKKTALAAEIIRLKKLIAEAEIFAE